MISLMEIVKALEQESIDALIVGNAERTQWINKGNYIKIVFWDKTGKPTDAHPHIETLLKRLASSNLTIDHQQEILKDCEDQAGAIVKSGVQWLIKRRSGQWYRLQCRP